MTRATFLAFALVLEVYLSTAAGAAITNFDITWEPSAAPGVVGYKVHVSSNSGATQQTIDTGMPVAVDGRMRARIPLEDGVDHTIAITSYDAAGMTSPHSVSDELLPFPSGQLTPEEMNLVAEAAILDQLRKMRFPIAGAPAASKIAAYDGLWFIDFLISMGAEYETCDLFGTGEPGILIGNLDRAVEAKRKPDYADLLVAYSPSSTNRFQTLQIARAGGTQLGIPSAEKRLACGDIDGDGLDEVVVGFGAGGGNRIQILNDAVASLRPLIMPGLDAGVVTPDAAFLAAGSNGATRPATGDLDGDGRDEIVVAYEGDFRWQLAIIEDVIDGAGPYLHPSLDAGKLVIPISARPSSFEASVIPVLVNLDADPQVEIVVAFVGDADLEWMVFDDANAGFVQLLP